MKYRLTVEQVEQVEPLTAAEREEFERSARYSGNMVSPEKVARTLVAELTEVEWQAVKKAVLEVM